MYFFATHVIKISYCCSSLLVICEFVFHACKWWCNSWLTRL